MDTTAPDPSEPSTLILGLGNLLRQDEGAGPHAVAYLQGNYPDAPGVRYLDGGTGGLFLLGELAGCDRLIVIDAARMDTPPGTVRLFPEMAMDRFVARPSGWNVHDVGLPDLMAAASLLPEGPPSRRALVAIEPEAFDWSERPSAAVASSLPEAADLVWHQLAVWEGEASPA